MATPDPQSEAANLPVPGSEPAAPESRAGRRERAASDALRALVRDFYLYRFGSQTPDCGPFRVDVRLDVDPSKSWETIFTPSLGEQLDEQLGEVQAAPGVYRRGRVYCFRCRSSDCADAVPPTPLCVFRGYGSTGVPEWWEMVQALVESQDERVHELYDKPPTVLARVQRGHDVKLRQLTAFGRSSKTYSILGQVAAGYFLPPAGWAARGRSGDRFAATFQLAETRSSDGRPKLVLNTLVGGMTPDDWDELMVSDWRPGVGRAYLRAAREAEDLQGRVLAARLDKGMAAARLLLGQVPGILQRMARALEHGARQERRRTRHVEERRQDRPVHKAFEEAREAKLQELYYDQKRFTYIACGKQGRAHVFNPEGQHVTTFVLPPGGAEFRVRTERWRALDAAEIAGFRALLDRPGRGAAPEAG